ncbi:MAG: serpin family protein [Gemmatimonadetes bacterium]|nr:serpin family protein [Gemmatimonadota bacterium]
MDLTTAEPVSSAVRALCVGFNGFGLDLHRGLPSGGNTFISPLSIGAALAALLPGARGQTAAELARVLRLQGTAEDTARAMAELRRILEPRRTEEETWNDETGGFETALRETFRLSLATGLFVEEAYPLHTAFCDALTEAFGAEFLSVTFANPEETADRVNTWVAEKTEGRITDLVSPDSLLPDMRLILANAVYFKARWADQFKEEVTRPKPFHLLPGAGTESVDVPMMAKQGTFLYWKSESADVEALRIDYEEGLSMLVVLPATGRFAEVEAGLSADFLARIQAGSEWTLVDLELPRFEMRFETSLGDVLRELGLQTAFTASADFGGITPHPDGLVLSEAIHQAWLKVDEHGTEAAAATALMAAGAGMVEEEPPRPIPFLVDRPFYFFIQERLTGAVLFMGRVLDPRDVVE